MRSAANQAIFRLDIDGFPHDLQVFEFRAKEALNQPYEVKLELVSERSNLDLESLLHRSAFLTFGVDDSGIHGQIHRIAQGASNNHLNYYQMTLVPHLAYLAHSHDQRIFQQQSVPQIIADVLKGHGLPSDVWRFQLNLEYAPRLYCVQYNETNLHFVQRLCEEEGLHFHFEHSTERHVLVFSDSQGVFPLPKTPTAFIQGSAMVAETPVIDQFQVSLQTRTSHVSRRDYDFRKPRQALRSEAKSTATPTLEDYAFPGQFTDPQDGTRVARRTLERHRADYRQARGRSDQSVMRSGHLFEMFEHPRQDWNGQWLLTEIEHIGKQPQVLEALIRDDDAQDDALDEFRHGYRNHFVATPWDVIFRPALEHPKSLMMANQQAVVTGPPGEDIYCDEFGRIKVLFPWDRRGQANEQSSCWLRVASGWAHDRYGSVLIPRVGMEVVVGFMEGDPDKPFVIGCVPNAATPVPLNLPAEHARSIFRSQTSPDGGGYNELRIEDRKGAEEIALRAQRNFVQHVLNDEHVHIGHQRTVVIGDDTGHASSRDQLRVKGDRHVHVVNQQTNATQKIHLGAGQQVVIDAAATLTIQAGGHWLTLGPEGIFSSVAIVQGGAPAAGFALGPQALLNVALDAAQQRRALVSNRASRCLICEAAQ